MTFCIAAGLFLQVAVQTGTHILFGILGGILFEKAGNTNLGTEGMMLMGASIGYFTGMTTGNPAAADASGINVSLYKYVHVLGGGFVCGLGGA